MKRNPDAVLATELLKNSYKIAKWYVCSLLAGVDLIKLALITRASVRAPDKHNLLGIQDLMPHEISSRLALNMENAWGIVRYIIDFLYKQKEGKYIIMKGPNQVVCIFLYFFQYKIKN